MDAANVFLLVCTVLCFYCTGASWMLQFVAYPTYLLVGAKEFVPFHVSFGKRLLPSVVVPMVLTCVGLFILVFARPANTPSWAVILAAVCAVIILLTTIFLEVPKHLKLDKDGKSDALINGLVRDNLPRTAAWTAASLLLAYALFASFPA